MKISMCQIKMHNRIEANLKNILTSLEKCHKNDVELAIFPECGLTGFHRNLPKQLDEVVLNTSYKSLSDFSRDKGISILIGSPKMESQDKILNSALLFSPNKKQYEYTSKVDLTQVEKLFFTKGETRKILEIEGLKIGVIFCIEMNEKEALLRDFQNTKVDLIAWISYIQWDDDSNSENSINYQNSLDISKTLNVPIINVNWANSVNDATQRNLGGSRFIDDGKILFSLEKDKEVLKHIEV